MLNITSALIGIASVVVAVLVMIRVIALKDIARIAMRGLVAIVSFVFFGGLVQMILPGLLTNAFVGWASTSLFVGVGFVVVVLVIALIAKWRNA
jgi:hypothetical protein